MPAQAICDGCGKREAMWSDALGNWHKPAHWYHGNTPLGWKLACTAECAAKVGAESLQTPITVINADIGLPWPIPHPVEQAMPAFPAVPENPED